MAIHIFERFVFSHGNKAMFVYLTSDNRSAADSMVTVKVKLKTYSQTFCSAVNFVQ